MMDEIRITLEMYTIFILLFGILIGGALGYFAGISSK